MRLIDTDKLIDDLIHFAPEHYTALINMLIEKQPQVDAVEVVRCKDCKHRILNEHYGEKGYMKLKAYCDLDTGDIFELGRNAEDDNWFCADAERRQDD